MKVADYLVRALAACGVRHIYGCPRSPLSTARESSTSAIRTISGCPRHLRPPRRGGYTVDRDYIVSKPDACFPIPSPAAVALTGYYPTRSCIRYTGKDEYTVIHGELYAAQGESSRAGSGHGERQAVALKCGLLNRAA